MFEDKQYNYDKAKNAIKESADRNADIILFPEMSFTGFSMNTALIQEEQYESLKTIKGSASKYGIHVGFGWAKKGLEMAENHYTIIDPSGKAVLDYIKIHPFSFMKENENFESGNSIEICSINDIDICTFICYDLRFPEIFQIASLKASVIVVAANWPSARRHHWECLLKARAIENQVYIVGINCVGTQNDIEYSGGSCIINPNGYIIDKLGDEEDLLICDVDNDAQKYREAFSVKKDRKTDLYKMLL